MFNNKIYNGKNIWQLIIIYINLTIISVGQDIEAFSDDNFDAADWINATFKSAESDQNKEVCTRPLIIIKYELI